MEYLGARGKMIHEKNLKSKISCQTPFNKCFLFWVPRALRMSEVRMKLMTAPLLELYRALRISEVRMRLMTVPLLELYRVFRFSEVRLRLMTAPLFWSSAGLSDSVR